MKGSTLILLASVVGSSACVNEIDNVTDFKTKKSEMDLIIDVRNWNEYTGSGDAGCNSGSDKMKCNYGHHSSMFFLENPNRQDKAVVYKVNGVRMVEAAVITKMKDCFADQISTAKVMTSCHSGSRSGKFQEKLVDAGFKCENIYNFMPGAKGLYEAWVAGDQALEMKNGTGSPGVFDYSTCPSKKTSGAVSWSFGLTAALVMGVLM